MEKPLSDKDISNYIPNVIVYSELPDQIVKLPAVILYETSPGVGHWVLLHKISGSIEFFDPYGIFPDKEFNFLQYKQPKYLSHLLQGLWRDGYKISYNQYPFQSWDKKVATCGRWVILRYLNRDKSLDQFKKEIDLSVRTSGKTPDEVVTSLVSI